jgi:hypothetical protein
MLGHVFGALQYFFGADCRNTISFFFGKVDFSVRCIQEWLVASKRHPMMISTASGPAKKQAVSELMKGTHKKKRNHYNEAGQRARIHKNRDASMPFYQRFAPRKILPEQMRCLSGSNRAKPIAQGVLERDGCLVIRGRTGAGKTIVSLQLCYTYKLRDNSGHTKFVTPWFLPSINEGAQALVRNLQPRQDCLIVDDAHARSKAELSLLKSVRCARIFITTPRGYPSLKKTLSGMQLWDVNAVTVDLNRLQPKTVQAVLQDACTELGIPRNYANYTATSCDGDLRRAFMNLEFSIKKQRGLHKQTLDDGNQTPTNVLVSRLCNAKTDVEQKRLIMQDSVVSSQFLSDAMCATDILRCAEWMRLRSDYDANPTLVDNFANFRHELVMWKKKCVGSWTRDKFSLRMVQDL